jgi:hypothetical protein
MASQEFEVYTGPALPVYDILVRIPRATLPPHMGTSGSMRGASQASAVSKPAISFTASSGFQTEASKIQDSFQRYVRMAEAVDYVILKNKAVFREEEEQL